MRIGDHNLQTTGETKLPEKTISVARALRHEGFNKTEAINDLALLELSEEVDIKVYTPVCLPKPDSSPDSYFDHKGTTNFGLDDYSDTLQEVHVPIVNDLNCERKTGLALHRGQICAGGVRGHDACQGDRGGPLTVSQQPHHHHVLVGITSYGLECGKEGLPGIYTKISFYRDWIQSNMKSPVICSK